MEQDRASPVQEPNTSQQVPMTDMKDSESKAQSPANMKKDSPQAANKPEVAIAKQTEKSVKEKTQAVAPTVEMPEKAKQEKTVPEGITPTAIKESINANNLTAQIISKEPPKVVKEAQPPIDDPKKVSNDVKTENPATLEKKPLAVVANEKPPSVEAREKAKQEKTVLEGIAALQLVESKQIKSTAEIISKKSEKEAQLPIEQPKNDVKTVNAATLEEKAQTVVVAVGELVNGKTKSSGETTSEKRNGSTERVKQPRVALSEKENQLPNPEDPTASQAGKASPSKGQEDEPSTSKAGNSKPKKQKWVNSEILAQQLARLERGSLEWSRNFGALRKDLESSKIRCRDVDQLARAYNAQIKVKEPPANQHGSVARGLADGAIPCTGKEKALRQRERKEVRILSKTKTTEKHLQDYVNDVVGKCIEGTAKAALREQLTFGGGRDALPQYAELLVAHGLGRIVEEELRINHRNSNQAYVALSHDRLTTVPDAKILTTSARLHALDGDIVRAFVLHPQEGPSRQGEKAEEVAGAEDGAAGSDTGKHPLGFVVAIVKEVAARLVIGTIKFEAVAKTDARQFYKFNPVDQRYPLLKIWADDADQHLAQVSDDGPQENRGAVQYFYSAQILGTDEFGHAIGELRERLGEVDDLKAEITAVLRSNGFSADDINFYQNLESVPPYEDVPITERLIAERDDLRRQCIFTIDPLTARDLDDALSLEVLGADLFEVGVHISDVAVYLGENSALDELVRGRATSIYLGNEVGHMLPEELCMRCSLLPGEDKLAFSVVWQLNGRGESVGEPRFCRSVINSCTQFAYQHAQTIIDATKLDPNVQFEANDFPRICNGFTVGDVAERIRLLNGIAGHLRRRRFENGSLSINNQKLRFAYDPDSGEPLSFEVEEHGEANFMIEEFMLLANQAAARLTFKHFPQQALLRNHGPPLANSMQGMQEKLSRLGLRLDASSSKALSSSIERLCATAADPSTMESFLNVLLTKPMARAKYFCPEGDASEKTTWHYALSIPIYTHFTSPIRRYADIVVHRHVAAALNYCPPSVRLGPEVAEIAAVCNDKKYRAKMAGDACLNLYFRRYISARNSITMDVVVYEIHQHSLNGVIIGMGHSVMINYADQPFPVNAKNSPNFVVFADRETVRPLSVLKVQIRVVAKILTGVVLLAGKRDKTPKINVAVPKVGAKGKPFKAGAEKKNFKMDVQPKREPWKQQQKYAKAAGVSDDDEMSVESKDRSNGSKRKRFGPNNQNHEVRRQPKGHQRH